MDKRSLQRTRRNIVRLKRRSRQAVIPAMVGGLQDILALARSRVPVLTGELKKSLGLNKTGAGAELVAKAPHATSVEFLDTPYIRSSVASGRRRAVGNIASIFRKLVR